MRKILKLNEFVDFYNSEIEGPLNESIEELTPAEIEALIYNQIIAVEEDLQLTEGLKEIIATIGNPVTFLKIKSSANKYGKGLISKYKIENEFQDKKDNADSKEEKDGLEVLKKQKLSALDDKIKAISDKMDSHTEGKATMQKLASLMRTKAKIKAAEAGIKDSDERSEIIDRLNDTAARKEEALRKAAETKTSAKNADRTIVVDRTKKTDAAPSGKKEAPAPQAPSGKKK